MIFTGGYGIRPYDIRDKDETARANTVRPYSLYDMQRKQQGIFCGFPYHNKKSHRNFCFGGFSG